MFKTEYKQKSQKYYICICRSSMLAKKKNSPTQPQYKKIV